MENMEEMRTENAPEEVAADSAAEQTAPANHTTAEQTTEESPAPVTPDTAVSDAEKRTEPVSYRAPDFGASRPARDPVTGGYCTTALVFSLLGLMFSVIFGAGAAFSVVSLIMSAAKMKSAKRTTLKWAFTISIVTIAICIAYWFALGAAANMGGRTNGA